MKLQRTGWVSSLLLAVAAVFALVLVGCGGKQVAPTSQKAASKQQAEHPTGETKVKKAKSEHPKEHPSDHPSDHPK